MDLEGAGRCLFLPGNPGGSHRIDPQTGIRGRVRGGRAVASSFDLTANRHTCVVSTQRRGRWVSAGVRVIRSPSGVIPSDGQKDVNDGCADAQRRWRIENGRWPKRQLPLCLRVRMTCVQGLGGKTTCSGMAAQKLPPEPARRLPRNAVRNPKKC